MPKPRQIVLYFCLLSAGCAASGPEPDDSVAAAEAVEAAEDMPADAPTDAPTDAPADAPADVPADVPEGTQADAPADAAAIVPAADTPRGDAIDRTQKTVHEFLEGSARRIDNLFGSAEIEEEASVSRGSVSVGGQYDDYNGFDDRVRLKARVALPAFKHRTSLIFGRSSADEFIDGSDNENISSLPARFNDIDDEDWLFGIGYSKDRSLKGGWDFDLGVRITSPPEPYVRASYRYNQAIGERWLLRMRPRVFWQEGRGDGVSLQTIVDFAPFENWLFRSYSIGVNDDRIEGVRWTQRFIGYNNVSDKAAFAYGVFADGETRAEVPLQDYGVELRFRRQISRDYLFMEILTYLSWPREFLDEERELTPGIGIEFEMQFGDWPGRDQD